MHDRSNVSEPERSFEAIWLCFLRRRRFIGRSRLSQAPTLTGAGRFTIVFAAQIGAWGSLVITSIDHIELIVRDVKEFVTFYQTFRLKLLSALAFVADD